MKTRTDAFRSLGCLAAAFALSALPAPAGDTSAWPGLRGPSYDGAVRNARLFGDLEAGAVPGLRVAWLRELGSGYPVVTVDGNRVVVGFQSGSKDVVAAFEAETGDELWRYEIAAAHAGHTGSHDGPIATPALSGGRVFGLGPRGQLFALDAETGAPLWTVDLVEDLEAEEPYYGFGVSPVVAGDTLIVPLGAGEGRSIGGFSVTSGELVWSLGNDTVEYNSPILATLGGRLQVVAAGTKHVRGIDPSDGALLWSHEHGGDERAMGGATLVPIPAGENRILMLHSHPESAMLEILNDGDSWTVRELWKSGAIKATYVQPVYHDGFLYGMNGKIFTCVDAQTGETRWRSREPGDGFPTLVGEHLVIMTKPGILRVAKASPDGYEEVASLSLFDTVAWSAPSYAEGRLYLRSMNALARVDPVVAPSANASSEPARAASVEAEDSSGAAAPASSSTFAVFLTELEALGDPELKHERVDDYLAGVSVPVIEESGVVHFLYRGEAKDVGIVGDMIGARREDPMSRVPGTDLFHYSTFLEPDAAVHYAFLVDFAEEPRPDPLNPSTGEGIFGDEEISFLSMPARRAEGFAEPEPASGDLKGRLEEISWDSKAFDGETRKATVYLPPDYQAEAESRYSTLYIHDGVDVLENGQLAHALDRSIGASVRPLIAVFVTPKDPENAGREFRGPAYVEMITTELVPLVDERYATRAEPVGRATVGVAGAADMSFRLAFEPPNLFGRVGALWPIRFDLDDESPAADQVPLVIYQTWGSYHIRSPHENFDAVAANRELRQRLRAHGYRPAGGEVPEGFGWNNFRPYVVEMLAALFPAP